MQIKRSLQNEIELKNVETQKDETMKPKNNL